MQALLNRNQAQLRMNAHPDKALQKEWNESGGSTFEYEILDTLTPSDDPAYDPADERTGSSARSRSSRRI